MFEDPFYRTHDGEIFVKSRCMYHERNTVDVLHNILKSKKYQPQDLEKRIWTQEQKKVIVCLADDFVICGANRSQPSAKWFDSNTIVVTDNYMPHTTEYRVLALPSSYFGVFNYVPEFQTFKPTRRFGLSVNRIDDQRILILLELIRVSGGLDQVLNQDWINFNGYAPEFCNNSQEDVATNFFTYWNQLSQHLDNIHSEYILKVVNELPIRNHDFSIEQAHVSAYLTLVIETYAGNDTVAFSEKIFRALVTPSPWMLFGAQNAVQHLKTLGFDIIDNLIDHSYDSNFQCYPGLAKISNFYKHAEQNYQKLAHMKISDISARCQQAAIHNQQLLAHFWKQWPADFEKFLLDFNSAI